MCEPSRFAEWKRTLVARPQCSLLRAQDEPPSMSPAFASLRRRSGCFGTGRGVVKLKSVGLVELVEPARSMGDDFASLASQKVSPAHPRPLLLTRNELSFLAAQARAREAVGRRTARLSSGEVRVGISGQHSRYRGWPKRGGGTEFRDPASGLSHTDVFRRAL